MGTALAAASLLLLTAAAFLLRLLISSHIQVVSQDAAQGYLYQARELLRGDWREGLGTYFPPGYPLIVVVFSRILGDVERAGKLVSVLSGALVVPLVFRMARHCGDGRGAWPAALLVATYPFLVQYSTDALSEGAYTLILTTGVWAGYRVLATGTSAAWTGVGGLLGAAYLIRGEAMGVMAVYVALVIWHHLAVARSGAGAWRTARCLASLLVGFCLLSAPYVGFLRASTGQWELSGKTAENFLVYDVADSGEAYEQVRYGLAADGRHLRIELEKGESLAALVWRQPGHFLKRYGRNVIRLWGKHLPRAIYPVYLILFGLGLHASVTRRADRLSAYLLPFFLFPFLFYPVFHVQPRFLVSVLPIALIWVGAGLVAVADALGAGSRRRAWWVLVGFLVISTLGHATAFREHVQKDPRHDTNLEQRIAGEWLREHGRPHARIMGRKAFVAFYAAGVPVLTPAASYPETLAYARASRVDYLVVDERYTAPVRPALRFLLDPSQAPRALEVVYSERAHPGAGLVIYRLRENDDTIAPGAGGTTSHTPVRVVST